MSDPTNANPYADSKIRTWRKARVNLDGTLKTPKMERFAWLLAEGFEVTLAWRTVGGTKDSRYRTAIMGDPAFKDRVERLRQRHAELCQQGPMGEALWMAMTTYTEARLANDLQTMVKCNSIIASLSEKLSTPPEIDAPPEKPKAEVGKPQIRGSTFKRSAAEMRESLMARGVRAP